MTTKKMKKNYDREEEGDECAQCGGLYQLGELWVKCDQCEEWMHAKCTELKGKSNREIDLLDNWCCYLCK